jgi:ABC-type multidrug transport system fused ATPase/permease subunit
LTLIFIGAAPVTIGVFGVLGKKIKKAKKKSLVSSAQMLNRIQESMNALRVVKVYNRQDHEIQRYQETNQTMLRRLLRVAKIDRMANPVMEVLGMFAASGALIAGAVWMSQERIEPEGFLTLLIMLGTSAESLRKVSDVWNKVQSANAAAERVFEVMDEPAEKEEPDAFELQPLHNNIKFTDIVFTYPDATTPALKGLDLCVEAGQTVAVVGPNGSGKSTLVNLIPRFYDPDSGQICFDGQDIHKATLESLRSQISMVTQNVITFNDTIASNIAYGKPGATTDEVIAAAKSAFADEFIIPLPDGYDTVIGENSAGFSGGQLQRIVIARAILKDPQILIFDEAMSQVDADSEMKIHNALSGLMKGRTCFLIAHRFSTVISADSIVVIDDGRIVAQGTHDELIISSEVYKRLYETQLMGGV